MRWSDWECEYLGFRMNINKQNTHAYRVSHIELLCHAASITLFFLMLTNGIYYSQTKFNQYTLWFQRKNEFYPKSKVEFQPIYIYILLHIYIISRLQPSSWQPVSENPRFPVRFIRYLSITFVQKTDNSFVLWECECYDDFDIFLHELRSNLKWISRT